jgi:hypothetical protein
MTTVNQNAIEALYSCGHSLLQMQRHSDAAAVFRGMVLCAPQDERGWLALGLCHEGAGQVAIALEMYAVAMTSMRAIRCALACADALRRIGREIEADETFELAATWATEEDDAGLRALVEGARRVEP